MVKNINAGIIGCNMSENFFSTSTANNPENLSWKKIFLGGETASSKMPAYAEIVEKADAILHDNEIDLVFVSANHLQFVKPVIEAGKFVRIV